MGPLQDGSFRACNQERRCFLSARRCRCLLKGCERPFHPRHRRSRYCSAECRAAARRWSQWRAEGRYRQTEQGRACRREQSRRFRERCRAREREVVKGACEGHHQAARGEISGCARPGCYVLFRRTPRSPCQKFCGPLCRQALRRVLVREARWRRPRGTPRRRRQPASPRAP